MNLVKLKPGRDMFRDSMTPFSSFFDSFFNESFDKGETANFFRPSVDVKENKDNFMLAFSLPGMEKENVKIELKENRLTVSGEHKMEKEENDAKYHRIENQYGSFSRSFLLPENVKQENIEANFKNGVLHISIPKAELAQPKAIEIK